MIDLHTWNTPNGRKVSIMLEEVGLPYRVHAVDIGREQQFTPEFLAISPNNKIPALVDSDSDQPLMESGAILIYLADKTHQLLPADARRYSVLQWLMWQMGGFGPMLGQTHHFSHYNRGKSDYAEARFLAETQRLYGVLDRQLARGQFVAGDYSIADIAIWPWVSRYEWQSVDLHAFPTVLRWYGEIAVRPAVQRGYHVPARVNEIPMPG